MPAVKKAKRKSQHREAIKAYEDWLKKNPKATHEQKFQAFNDFIDSSELAELLNG